MSCVTCHMSLVRCHLSHVTCQLSHVNIFFFFYIFCVKKKSKIVHLKKVGKIGEASRWRVCYLRGLPRLVLSHLTHGCPRMRLRERVWFWWKRGRGKEYFLGNKKEEQIGCLLVASSLFLQVSATVFLFVAFFLFYIWKPKLLAIKKNQYLDCVVSYGSCFNSWSW